MHETLICSRSKFFREASNGQWKESGERKIALAEVEPSVFLTYLDILYVSNKHEKHLQYNNDDR